MWQIKKVDIYKKRHELNDKSSAYMGVEINEKIILNLLSQQEI